MPRERNIRLSEHDHDVLDALAHYRFLSAPQAGSLFFPSERAAQQRLGDLVKAKLAVPVFMPVRPYDRTTKTLWAISGKGARLLAPRHHGIAPRHLTSREQRSGLFLAHTSARNDLRVALERLQLVDPHFALLSWQQAPEVVKARAEVQVGSRSRAQVTIIPDGVILCRMDGECQALAVEIDMGTVPIPRMWRRYRAYWSWWRRGGARARFGPVPYRVLTLAPDKKRLDALRNAAIRAPERGRAGSKLFWFAPLGIADITDPTKLLSAAWSLGVPGTTTPQPLFGSPNVPPTP